jgi:hypothetical protein
MKWLLVFMIFGTSPVPTNLVFDTLDQCLAAEDEVRRSYGTAFNRWRDWARANPTASNFPDSEPFQMGRIGLRNQGVCIPHNAP